MVPGFLTVHLQMQYRKTTGERRHWGSMPPGGDPCTYKMVLPIYGGPRKCPVEECWGQAET